MIKKNFNDNWIVYPTGDEKHSKKITLPYDAMIYEDRESGAPSGKNCCWILCKDYTFTKEFVIEKKYQDNDIVLEFEGAYHDATVYINDEKVMFRPYGYTNFYVDITKYITFGKPNTIKVTTINSDQPNSRFYSGSGIYRPVNLFILEKERIELNGLKIKTLDYKTKNVEFNVKTSAKGHLIFNIYNLDNILLEHFEADTNGEVSTHVELPKLDLWSLEHPNIYKCKVTFNEFDEYETTFGIRQTEMNDKGYFLNGQKTLLLGCCIHSDNQILGAITNDFVEERRIKKLKEAGYNAIRSAHNPCSKSLLRACDKLGMLVLDEYVDCWYIHKTPYDYVRYLKDYWKEDLRDMVDKDYNHPCVIMYSTGNEVGETAHKKGIELTKEFTDFIHSMDTTRPVTVGINIFFNFISSLGIGFYSDKKAAKEAEKAKKKKNKKKKAVGSEFLNNLTKKI